MKPFVLFLLILSLFVPAYGKLNIEWLETVKDFGAIKETDGKQTAVFKFVNRGRKPVEIEKAVAGCGCTDVSYPEKKIERGDTGIITVSYDPFERPGKFDKEVMVYFSKQKNPEELRIEGTVIASDETLSLFFPYKAGNLHFDTQNLDFGEIEKGVKKRDFIDIYNSSENPVMPVITCNSPVITFEMTQEEISPGNFATLTVYLDSAKEGWTGERAYKIKIETEGEEVMEIGARALITP